MSHTPVEIALDAATVRPPGRRGFLKRPLRLVAVCLPVLALVGPGLTVSASAQVMGEYGGVTAHSAAAASSMPKVSAPNLGTQVYSPRDESSEGASEEDRTYDAPSNVRSEDDKDTDKGDDAHGDWNQVK